MTSGSGGIAPPFLTSALNGGESSASDLPPVDSSVGIVTGYGLDDRGVGVRVPVG
jgi:hypothetical protein